VKLYFFESKSYVFVGLFSFSYFIDLVGVFLSVFVSFFSFFLSQAIVLAFLTLRDFISIDVGIFKFGSSPAHLWCAQEGWAKRGIVHVGT